MKEIKLTQGKFTLVSDEDYEWLNQWKWFAWKSSNTYYARRNIHAINGKRTAILMHRLILGIVDPKILGDHKDRNGLNNQRSNLRKATFSQNVVNVESQKNSSSSYLGVTLLKSRWKGKVYFTWRAQIMKNRVKYHLGCFKTETEAALAFNNAAIQIHGEFASLNKITA